MAETKYKFDDPEAAFAEAEERIQQALMSGEEELDLSHIGLTELPASLSQLSKLRELRLYGNRLAMLPSFLGDMKQLNNLFLSDNKLSSLPEFICELTQLRDLNLGGSRFYQSPWKVGRTSVT